ncbi:MAG: TetR/AcrR family transcriptional regulator [Alphaproteobacteria bacterium]|nr:TetR/AcrR family transcriptional regulator [Alphaproteobacteria bacterium]
MSKDNIQSNLVNKGRELIKEKGSNFLTARKLSEASGYSVGTIYNQFGNMDNFIVIQNYLTLEELYYRLSALQSAGTSYQRLNLYVKEFINFVLENKNLWFLVHNFHLLNNNRHFSRIYLKRVIQITKLVEEAFKNLFPNVEVPERMLSIQILWLSLFSLSSFLTTDILDSFNKINKQTLCELLLNTYLAGMKVLEKASE